MLADPLAEFFTDTSLVAVLVAVIGGAISAWLGWTRADRVPSAEFVLVPESDSDARNIGRSGAGESPTPFEVAALSNYYKHALMRANVSFWFSIIFGAIGFGVIIVSFATHQADDVTGTIVKATSGAVIDAVASLFFVQSTNAQKSMMAFFENLRLDRLNVEARALINEIESIERRDQLRSQLVLKYAGIDKLLVG